MNGAQVRNTWFWPPRETTFGYDAREVDDLLHRLAAELDAGRPAGPLIENATLRKGNMVRAYCDIDAVDWFLGRLLVREACVESAGSDADPWGDLPVPQLISGQSAAGFAELHARGKPRLGAYLRYFVSQCENAWLDFGQQPGTRLWWGRAGGLMALRTAEQQTLVSVRGLWKETYSAGGKSFTLKRTSAGSSSSPGVAELRADAARDNFGHFAKTWSGQTQPTSAGPGSEELADDTGTPILYTSGRNFNCRAYARIMFADQRWLRFLVRGTRRANAIMTAVDQAGNRIARYRIIDKGLDPGRKTSYGLSKSVEIMVHPGCELTDELAVAIVISAPWLRSYFESG
jgi:hypothetical protein